MTLREAFQQMPVKGIRLKDIEGQEEGFQFCCDFLAQIPKTQSFNWLTNSTLLKSVLENPSGRWGTPHSTRCNFGPIHEGTLILACLASGFTMRQDGENLGVLFNLSEKGLKEKTRALVLEAVGTR